MEKKQYIHPVTTVIMVETTSLMAGSGEETMSVFGDTTLGSDDAVFARESDGGFWDDDE